MPPLTKCNQWNQIQLGIACSRLSGIRPPFNKLETSFRIQGTKFGEKTHVTGCRTLCHHLQHAINEIKFSEKTHVASCQALGYHLTSCEPLSESRGPNSEKTHVTGYQTLCRHLQNAIHEIKFSEETHVPGWQALWHHLTSREPLSESRGPNSEKTHVTGCQTLCHHLQNAIHEIKFSEETHVASCQALGYHLTSCKPLSESRGPNSVRKRM